MTGLPLLLRWVLRRYPDLESKALALLSWGCMLLEADAFREGKSLYYVTVTPDRSDEDGYYIQRESGYGTDPDELYFDEMLG